MRRAYWWIAGSLVLGVALVATGAVEPPNLEKALQSQRQLAAQQPDNPAVWNDLGNLLVLAGDLEQAEASYQHSLELDPNRVSAHFNLGLLLQQMGHRKEALQEYQQALKLDPRNAWAHYQIGTIYESLGQRDPAVQAYAKAFALDPQLAFPEVNPHVIESHLVTEAMLDAYKVENLRPLAPKAYDQPGHIADMLVPPPPPSEQQSQEGTKAQAAEKVGGEGAEPTSGSATGASGVYPPRMLTEEDLDQRGNVNQASPSSPRTGRRPVTGGVRRGFRGGSTVIISPQEGAARPGTTTPGATGQPQRIAPEGRVFVPPNRVRYRPGTASSGRLEMKFLGPGSEKPEGSGQAG